MNATPFWSACFSSLHFDRFLLGELSGADAAEVRAHLPGCARCSEAVESLRPREELPPLRIVPLPPRRWPRVVAAAAAIAAAASVLIVIRAPSSERLKGSGFALAMYVQHGADVRRAGPGENVAPGDAVRFSVTAPRRGYVAVLSLDPRRHASIYFPLDPRASPVEAGRDVLLPLATRLDATAGEERLTALFCDAPVLLEPLRAALEAGALHLPDGCQEARWSFVKG